jgi:glycosyltransferase involved in cell wall biosynthesis
MQALAPDRDRMTRDEGADKAAAPAPGQAPLLRARQFPGPIYRPGVSAPAKSDERPRAAPGRLGVRPAQADSVDAAARSRSAFAGLKTALVHYWLVRRRGGEAVLESLGRLVPHADLVTNVVDPSSLFGSLQAMPLRTTFVNRLPAARKLYPAYMPLMPMALEGIDMNPYDLIISSEAGPAKWVLPSPGAVHICYCHSPLRYVWDQRLTYFRKLPTVLHPFAHLMGRSIRHSDLLSSFRVTTFAANSSFVASRIRQYYRREAEVIHPPIDLEDYTPGLAEDFYLCAGQVVSYKRIDIAVEACRRLGRRLIVAGDGEVSRLKDLAGPHATFLGRVDRPVLLDLMRRCRALLFPGVEDFGLVPVEVMASGRPVIAYGDGGVLDTVEPGASGVLFDRQDADALASAILEFEALESRMDADACRRSARRFARPIFERKFIDLATRALKGDHDAAPRRGRRSSGRPRPDGAWGTAEPGRGEQTH